VRWNAHTNRLEISYVSCRYVQNAHEKEAKTFSKAQNCQWSRSTLTLTSFSQQSVEKILRKRLVWKEEKKTLPDFTMCADCLVASVQQKMGAKIARSVKKSYMLYLYLSVNFYILQAISIIYYIIFTFFEQKLMHTSLDSLENDYRWQLNTISYYKIVNFNAQRKVFYFFPLLLNYDARRVKYTFTRV
jgi:hypothetical protein